MSIGLRQWAHGFCLIAVAVHTRDRGPVHRGGGGLQAGRVHAAGKVLSFLVALPPSRDLLFCAKDLFVAARTMGCSHDKTSATRSGSVSLAIA
jgi:hypothetical protein